MSTCQVTEVNIAMAGYEFYTITSSLAASDLIFSGVRYADGKNVVGSLHSDGTISISEETSSSSEIMNLLRLN